MGEVKNPVRMRLVEVPVPVEIAETLKELSIAMDVPYTKMASELLSGAIVKCRETLDAMAAQESPPDTQDLQ